jgi:Ca-activated chloride channel family protein
MSHAPQLSHAFSVTPCRLLTRAPTVSRRYARVVIQAPSSTDETSRAAVHVAFILDRSGSMMGQKLETAKAAVDHALGQLRPGDRFAVVAFDDTVDRVMPLSDACPEAIAAARAAIARIESGRSTNISEAWVEGCQLVAPGAGSGVVVRALLLTDGQATAGLKRASELAPHVAALRDAGVATTCFGLGLDFDEEFLATIARAGSGNFHFIRDASLIPAFIAQELGESLMIVSRRPSLHVEVDPDVSVKPSSDFPARRLGPGHLEVPLPDLCAGQTLEVVLAFDVPARSLGVQSPVSVTVTDEEGGFSALAARRFAFTAAPHPDNDSQPRDADVDLAVARIYAARAERDAIRYNRRQEYDRAREVLGATARRIASYAGRDAELSAIVTGLTASAERYGRPLDELMRKTGHAGTVFMTRSRDASGASRRA